MASCGGTHLSRFFSLLLLSFTMSSTMGRVLCIITGASRGFGWAVALHMSRVVKPGSALVLTARSADDLRALQEELTTSEAGRAGLKAVIVPADLGEKEGPERVLKQAGEAFDEDMDHVILINNAASLGDVSRFIRDFTNMAEVDSYMSFNVTSFLCLTAGVLQRFPQRPGLKRTVVNVSTMAAIQAYPSWVLYCSGKAARLMMMRVLAQEEPDLRVLNYSPGPLDTAMLKEALSKTAHSGHKKSILDLLSEGKLLTCEDSCAQMMKLLLDDKFTSGDHIDIFDL
ncbi:sepiapterin reductase-like [Cheilinus undulatus]|uniref:sepiapterin reductase-like n=1 Tax=Cheilinus undulatus TaxID=241271 RepID=UPI001BD1CCC5|nr:sepiapterin reductase-like [Cheilinus undulatus]